MVNQVNVYIKIFFIFIRNISIIKIKNVDMKYMSTFFILIFRFFMLNDLLFNYNFVIIFIVCLAISNSSLVGIIRTFIFELDVDITLA